MSTMTLCSASAIDPCRSVSVLSLGALSSRSPRLVAAAPDCDIEGTSAGERPDGLPTRARSSAARVATTRIRGIGGRDLLLGGKGRDGISGGPKSDPIRGGGDSDTILGDGGA